MSRFDRIRAAAALLAAVVALAAGAVACSMDQRIREKSQDLTNDLMTAAIDFNRMIAWRYFDDAAAVVIPQTRENYLMTAESIAQRVHIESFNIVMVQVSDRPFTRIRGEVPDIAHPKKPQIEPPAPDSDADKTPEPITLKKMPKVWYGLAMVRYVNLSVLPHTQVRSPLIRQYWYWSDSNETWMVDPEIEQLLEMDRPPAPAPAATPTPPAAEKPLAPAPH